MNGVNMNGVLLNIEFWTKTQICHIWTARLDHVGVALDLWSLHLASINLIESACRGLILGNHVTVWNDLRSGI